MPARHAVLLTEHAAKHAHLERDSRAEASLIAASLPIPVRFTQLLSRRQPASLSPLAATLMDLLASVANKRLTAELNPLDATLTENRGVGVFFPFWNLSPAWRQPFFSITYALHILQPFCFHIHACNGGVYTLAVLFSKPATRMKARNLARPHPAFVTSLHLCFITSFFHYNRCASIRGRNEFPPAIRRDPHRLRAPLLGRQHHGALRASLVLRRVCLFGPLPSRSPQLSDGARHEFDRALWRPGMVPGDLRRRDRRPPRFPPRPLSGLSAPPRPFILHSFDRVFVPCGSAQAFAIWCALDTSSPSPS